MPAGSHGRTFDQFVQASPGARTSVSLGLAFYKFWIEARGGGIREESAPRHVSVFRFSLLLLSTSPDSSRGPSPLGPFASERRQ